MKPARRIKELDPAKDPWTPIVPTQREANAIKSLAAGNANDVQQGEVLAFIFRLTGIKDLEFRPDERASVFASGKRFVGLQIAKTINLSSEAIKQLPLGS